MDALRTLYLASVTLHILTAALWAGGMLFLVFVIVPLLRTPALRDRAVALVAALGLRFRNVGWASFLVLIVTGTINAAYRAQSAGALLDPAWWSTPFGRLLAEKLGVVTVILLLSAIHDFHVGPRASALLEAEPGTPRTLRWQHAARWMGRINLLLAVAVIAMAVALARGGW
jgi:putative copper export protein